MKLAAAGVYTVAGLITGTVMEVEQAGLLSIISNNSDALSLLLFSGIVGAFVKAIYDPEKHWRRRLVQGFGGVMSAIFLGGLLGHLLQQATGAGIFSFAASGFIMGFGGELGVKWLQEKLMKVAK